MAGSKSGNGALLRRKNEEIKDLNEENAKLRLSVDGLEKERNFYFGKLREIEILCQADDIDAASVREKVLAILYQTDDKEEFQAPEEETAAVSVQ